MDSAVISDWRQIDLTTPDGTLAFRSAVQHYLAKPDADLGYEHVFDIIDFTGTEKNGFTITSVGHALTFGAKPGEKARIVKVGSKQLTVGFDRYGGSLGWEKPWFDDAEFWNIEGATKQFRSQWYESRSQIFYDLISASRADADMAWQGDIFDIILARDVQTINYACSDIISSLSANGYDVNPMTRFVILVPANLGARLNHDGLSDRLEFNIELVVTTKIKNQARTTVEEDQYFVCLPGRKAKAGYRQELTLTDETDMAYAETVAAWGRYGGVVGDPEQFRRCAIK